MFGQHASSTPVDAPTSAPEGGAAHRKPGLPALQVNAQVYLIPTTPEEAILASMLGIPAPTVAAEIVGVEDVANGIYEVAVPCDDHGAHRAMALYGGTSTTPEPEHEGDPQPEERPVLGLLQTLAD